MSQYARRTSRAAWLSSTWRRCTRNTTRRVLGPGGTTPRHTIVDPGQDLIDRREFLKLATGTAVAAGLAGCTKSNKPDGAHGASSGAPSRSTVPSSASPTPPAAGDLDALSRTLGDRLILPDDARYLVAAQLYDPRFDGVRPAAVARCASAQDVQACLKFVKATGTALAVKSGGHSYAGYSTTSGLVIDVGAMNAVGQGKSAGTASIGAGARLADVYAKLAADGVSIPAGSCPTVGVTGLALGGGIGVVARKYGLTCDTITAVTVVLADGSVVRCNEAIEPDLYWAHRGGGGGNFGVVTALEFRAHPTRSLTYFLTRWSWGGAENVISAWQQWVSAAPDELWSSLHVDGAGSASDTPHVYATGVYVGDPTGLAPLLNELQAAAKAPMTTRFVKETDYLTTMMVEGGCADYSVAQCRPRSEGGKLPRESQLARSDYLASALSATGVDTILKNIEARQRQRLYGGSVLFDAYGGAINRVGATDTAFAHRDKLACLQYVAPLPKPGLHDADQAWLDGLWQAMRPYVSGYAYQNYIDPKLPDWQHAYYGVNLDRLARVKSTYDPENLFRFAQSIPVSGAVSGSSS